MAQVVEITKGSKVKYELDKKTGLIKVCKTATLHAFPPTSLKTSLDCIMS